MGGPKAQMMPPMNSGVAIASTPAIRVSEMHTQTDDAIFDRFDAGINPSMGTATIFEVGESSQQSYDSMNMIQLKDIASQMGLKTKKKSKIQIVEDIKELIRNGVSILSPYDINELANLVRRSSAVYRSENNGRDS